MNKSARQLFADKVLSSLGKNGGSIDEFKKKMVAYDALEAAKRLPHIEDAVSVLQLRMGDRRALEDRFDPKVGDFVRGVFEHFEGVCIRGLGEVSNETVAAALGRNARSVGVAKGWKTGLNWDRLTRKPLMGPTMALEYARAMGVSR